MNKSRVISAAVLLGVAVLIIASLAWAAGCGGGGGSHSSCATDEKSSKDDHHKAGGSSGFLTSYFEMRSLLASDKTTDLDKLSKTLTKDVGAFRASLASGPKDSIRPDQISALKDIEKAAPAMKTSDIKVARENFKGLSRAVLAYVKTYGYESRAYSFYCDMVKEGWLQETDKTGNPYFGSQMMTCGMMTGQVMDGKYAAK